MQDFTLPELGPYVRGKPENVCLEGQGRGRGKPPPVFWSPPPVFSCASVWVFTFFVLRIPPLEPARLLCCAPTMLFLTRDDPSSQ